MKLNERGLGHRQSLMGPMDGRGNYAEIREVISMILEQSNCSYVALRRGAFSQLVVHYICIPNYGKLTSFVYRSMGMACSSFFLLRVQTKADKFVFGGISNPFRWSKEECRLFEIDSDVKHELLKNLLHNGHANRASGSLLFESVPRSQNNSIRSHNFHADLFLK